MSQPPTPSSRFAAPVEALAEDFLYHLYRGSAFLAEGQYDGARAELDRALRTQPRDAAAQDLLAKLYFKLGVYPRAIELYSEIVRQFPDRVPPRVNLALAYIKTGQMREAVDNLLPVVEREPGHTRAWGYLGLAWSRLSEHAKAREAFLRAGHNGMARRMEEALEAQYGAAGLGARPSIAPLVTPPAAPPAGDPGAAGPAGGRDESSQGPAAVGAPAGRPRTASGELSLDEVDIDALDNATIAVADSSLAASPGPWLAREPGDALAGEARVVRAAPSVREFAQRAGLAPRGGGLELDGGALVVVGGCAARLDARALGAGVQRGDEVQRAGGAAGGMLGAPRLVWVRAGWVVQPAAPGTARALLALEDEPLVAREEAIAAFEGSLFYESEVLAAGSNEPAMHVVTLRGRGRVALEAHGAAVRAIRASESAPVQVPRAALLAWTPGLALAVAQLAPIDGPAPLELRGAGTVIVALAGGAAAAAGGVTHG